MYGPSASLPMFVLAPTAAAVFFVVIIVFMLWRKRVIRRETDQEVYSTFLRGEEMSAVYAPLSIPIHEPEDAPMSNSMASMSKGRVIIAVHALPTSQSANGHLL